VTKITVQHRTVILIFATIAMRILILSKKIPFPVKDGESIAIMHLAEQFARQGNAVTLLAMQTPKHDQPIGTIDKELLDLIAIHSVFVDTRITIFGIIRNIFTFIPYHIQRFISKKYKNKLKEILTAGHFDIIQLEGLFLVPYIPCIIQYTNAKIVLRSHNIEGNIWKRMAVNETNLMKKFFLLWQAKKFLRYELKNMTSYDAIVPISLSDEKFYAEKCSGKKIKYVPACIQVIPNAHVSGINYNAMYFLGALDWLPNIEGLQWFLQAVYPLVKKKLPGMVCYVAGRNMDTTLSWVSGPGIYAMGEVPQAAEFIKDKWICIVPLLSGSGMKVKIAEAVANGKVVVTTPVGAEGFPSELLSFIEIAHSAEEFALAIEKIIMHPETYQQRALQAAAYVKVNFNPSTTAASLIHFYKTL
jgi:glycosyltransferase involved in cell wall biosynthesis